MQIRIKAAPVGPLSVLAELPDAQLATLEGLNGIGKSLTIRLLQICCGTMPYRTDSDAWASLCRGLGEFSVVVEGIQGANRIEWKADSRDWEVGPSLGAQAVSFSSLTIDDTPCSLEEVRALISIERIAGDEGLVDTLAQQAEADAELVRVFSRRFAGPETGPLATLEASVDDALQVLPSWKPQQFVDAEKRLTASTKDKESVQSSLRTQVERGVELRLAAEIAGRLGALRAKAPALTARLREVDERLVALRRTRESLDHEISKLAGKVAMAEPAARELQNARRTLDRNREKLQHAANRSSASAGSLGLPVSDEPAIRAARANLVATLGALRQRQNELDATPAMREVLRAIVGELTNAEHSGLADQIVLEDSAKNLALTVEQALEGALTRKARLENQPLPPEAREVAEEIVSKTRELSRVADLIESLEEAARFRRLVGDSEERVTNALVVADPQAEEEMRKLDRARRESDDELMILAAERAGLQEQLGIPTGESASRSLTDQLNDALGACGVHEDELPGAIAKHEESSAALQRRLDAAVETSEAASRELAQASGEAHRASETLMEARFEWLTSSVARLPNPSGQAMQQLVILDEISERLKALLERLGAHRAQLGAVSAALQTIAEHLRGQDVTDVKYRLQFEEVLSQRFSAWFNIERVRDQLLPNALGEVQVSVHKRSVSWQERTGQKARPLEAFSSGEQAFAYTRARLGVLDETNHRARNRLIVLDEFGAFISHDRMGQLLAYLKERITQQPADRVLVILPLSRDYASLASNAIGDEGRRLEGLAKEIERRKYAVQVVA